MNAYQQTFAQDVRVIGTYHGSLLGPEFKVAIGDRYFWVGALTLKQLKSGYSPDELDLYEIDPDAPDLEDC